VVLRPKYLILIDAYLCHYSAPYLYIDWILQFYLSTKTLVFCRYKTGHFTDNRRWYSSFSLFFHGSIYVVLVSLDQYKTN